MPSRRQRLAALRKRWRGCERCAIARLAKGKVFSRGSERPKFLFIGIGPGATEDFKLIPFVGKAGRLLDDCLSAAGFDMKELHWANLLLCRPRQGTRNRDPLPEEVANCRPRLKSLLRILRPPVVVLLGQVAEAHATELALLEGCKVEATWHPAPPGAEPFAGAPAYVKKLEAIKERHGSSTGKKAKASHPPKVQVRVRQANHR